MSGSIKGAPRNFWHYSWITILLVTPVVLLADFVHSSATDGSGWELTAGRVAAAAAVSLAVALFVILAVGREQARMTQQLRERSTTDELTGLRNRRGFFSLAEQQLRLARRKNEKLCLFYADVDDFKLINEKLGNREGDNVLREVAQTLVACYRETDIVARVGGDEFLVMPVGMLPEESSLVIDRFNKAFARVQWHGHDAPATVSFGLAIYDPEAPCTLDELISEAGTAMRGTVSAQQDTRHSRQAASDRADSGPAPAAPGRP
ncbi:MAG: GGDEF domain-containing protein [Thermoleophilia bacterium]